MATISIVLFPLPSGGAQPPLASLVSADVGLVIEVRGLAEQIEAFGASPTCRRVAHYPPFEKWTKENGHFWNAVSNESLQRLGAVPGDIVSNLLGNEVLFAAWPPAGDSRHGTETGQGDALLLVRANDGPLLQTVLDRLIAVHRESGRWKGQQSFEQSGRTFEVNEIETSHDQPRLFLAVAERLGVVSSSQRLIRET
ncbi:MAG TPA: hypothetical protein VGX76_00785, partial [Pirellulales bacterium]|nr:hypothetical protein [Pirellulales bacterium]